MSAFSRAVVPNATTEPIINGAPLVAVGRSGKSQSRATTAVGIMWTEKWPIIDHESAAGRAFIGHVRQRIRSPDSFTIKPYRYIAALGTVAADVTGAVNGASQTGTSFALNSFSADGTILEGDYLTGIGPGACFLTAGATVSGGAATVSVDPPVFDVAHAPANGATVTVNGVVNARIGNAAQVRDWLETVQQTEYVAGLTLTFVETLE